MYKGSEEPTTQNVRGSYRHGLQSGLPDCNISDGIETPEYWEEGGFPPRSLFLPYYI